MLRPDYFLALDTWRAISVGRDVPWWIFSMKRYFEFVLYRSLAEMQADMSRMFLGMFLWLIEPVAYMAIFYLIFGLIFQQRGEDFVSFLLTGLVFWKWFSSTVSGSVNSIQRNMPLINQVYMPKVVFPLVAVVTSTMRFTLVFVVLVVYLLLSGAPFTSAWLVDLPLLLVLQALLTTGLAMTISSMTPLVPDLKFVVDNGLMLLFFLSGIFFRFDFVPDTLRPYFDFNPIGVLIHGFREVLVFGRHVDWSGMWAAFLFTVVLLALGYVLLSKLDRVYPKRAFL